MKKFGFFLIALLCLLTFPGLSKAASAGTHIFLDGNELEQPKGAQAGLVKGNVMVPIRIVGEGLGYQVGWDKKTSTVTISQDGTIIHLVLGKYSATVNDNKVKLNGAPLQQADTTLVPLRFVGEQMGLQVSWDNESKSAYLYSPNHGSSGKAVPGGSSKPPVTESQNSGTVPEPEQDNTYQTNVPSGDAAKVDKVMINGVSFSENRLMVAVSGAVKPNVFKMSGPERIVVDIPNADFGEHFTDTSALDATKNGQLPVTEYPDVSQIRYSLFSTSPSTVRFVIDLTQSSQFTVTNAGDGLVIVELTDNSSSPGTVIPNTDGKPTVVIDAGHGGSQPGTLSATKKQEKDFTLAVALKVEKLLAQQNDIHYIMTRTTDVKMSLEDRVKVANDNNATLFVSIHGNSINPGSNPSGSETYYTREASIPLAKVMHKHLVEATGFADRKVRYSSLHVTRETTMPAVLLEVGYLSNSNDEAAMYTEDFQQRVAEGIVAGIREYLGL
ncbi:N-acetylmuramoyl-L-alanine amidase [Paenibacillus puldeungensis]|uniref:N-acetylmuramoyl-L-alanine amidase n=1 Tax=Paenibacillus puldeungensis TaxID=696536 RepID=A0ABW3S1Z3_9BACL